MNHLVTHPVPTLVAGPVTFRKELVAEPDCQKAFCLLQLQKSVLRCDLFINSC